MTAISQTILSNAFSWMKILKFRLKFHWSLFPRVQLTISKHWFRKWLGAVQATSHYLNQWSLVYRRIYASLGLNELTDDFQMCDADIIASIFECWYFAPYLLSRFEWQLSKSALHLKLVTERKKIVGVPRMWCVHSGPTVLHHNGPKQLGSYESCRVIWLDIISGKKVSEWGSVYPSI